MDGSSPNIEGCDSYQGTPNHRIGLSFQPSTLLQIHGNHINHVRFPCAGRAIDVDSHWRRIRAANKVVVQSHYNIVNATLLRLQGVRGSNSQRPTLVRMGAYQAPPIIGSDLREMVNMEQLIIRAIEALFPISSGSSSLAPSLLGCLAPNLQGVLAGHLVLIPIFIRIVLSG
jgi:hypothetical protein